MDDNMKNTEIIPDQDVNTDIIRPVVVNGITHDSVKDIDIYKCTLKDNGDIEGYTEDNIKVLYRYSDNKFYYGKDIGNINLINLSQRTEEERKRIGAIGGQKSKERREREKNLKEIAQALLKATTGERQKKQILGENYAETFGELETNGEVMLARMILGAMDGSFKCAEFVRDTAGEKPKNEISADVTNIMTDADRALIEKLEKRTS